MRKFLSLLCVVLMLSGCWLSLNFSQEIQDKWRGQPIENIIKRLGPFHVAQNKKGEKYVYWERSFQKSTPTGYELAYCQARAFYDEHGKITRLDTYSRGANCAFGFSDSLK